MTTETISADYLNALEACVKALADLVRQDSNYESNGAELDAAVRALARLRELQSVDDLQTEQ